jgi:hypothetical protein
MTLGVAAAAGVRLIVWCREFQLQSSPTQPRWLLGAALKHPCSTGATGWSVRDARAGKSTHGGDRPTIVHAYRVSADTVHSPTACQRTGPKKYSYPAVGGTLSRISVVLRKALKRVKIS